MQTTAIGMVANSLSENGMILITLLISKELRIMITRKREILLVYMLVLLGGVLCACDSLDENRAKDKDKTFNICNLQLTDYGLEVVEGEAVRIFGEGFMPEDQIVLISIVENKRYVMPVLEVFPESVWFRFPKQVVSGRYLLSVIRDGKTYELGETDVRILSRWGEIPDKPEMDIKGYVRCGEKPLEGVVVTDGYSVTQTDASGIYYLSRHASSQFVIISMPSGYEANTVNNIPEFFHRLAVIKDGSVVQHDFQLRQVDNRRHVVITPTDLHLANRFNKQDITWFRQGFVEDVNALIASYISQGIRPYILTLGDLSSDAHWYSDGYDLSHYIKDMRPVNAPIFNAMGNHDNDVMQHGDWIGEQPYRDIVGPVYYSFNLGDIHYVVLDNTIWINPPGQMSQSKAGMTEHQLEWLKKDLSFVSKDKPVYVAMHCQISSLQIAGLELKPSPYMQDWQRLFDCFEGFSDVHFLTGHTHVAYNVNYGVVGYPHIYEHNTPAVSAIWWWTTSFVGREICDCGAPGGYGVYEVNGTKVWRRYKGTGKSIETLFRTYDRNQIWITSDRNLPTGTSGVLKSLFDQSVGEYFFPSNENHVLINVWGYGPGWNISVRENGRSLTVRRVAMRDPLKVLAYNRECIVQEGKFPNASAANGVSWHLFVCKASSPNTPLDIEVTDDQGAVYREHMIRPKQFDISAFD